MTEKFRPDGSEDRALFFSAWCFQFQRDRAMREGADIDECDDDEVCPIVARVQKRQQCAQNRLALAQNLHRKTA